MVQLELMGIERMKFGGQSFKPTDKLIATTKWAKTYGTPFMTKVNGEKVTLLKNIFSVMRDPKANKPDYALAVFLHGDILLPDKIGADWEADKDTFLSAWGKVTGQKSPELKARPKYKPPVIACPTCARKAKMSGQVPLI